ncbi:MAG: sulfurylase large subunit, molybdopterin cytosine dinucleotide biosynthesis [Acidobacteria bacterium]|nr:sulfurylase large subunit, molybdopterin cytosine dinucleotide biosynthesis [Acidobacteriota bacterium]
MITGLKPGENEIDILMTKAITESIARVLEQGGLATLATLVHAPEGVGAKLLLSASEVLAGSLGNKALDIAAAEFSSRFLNSRQEASTLTVAEFAPQLHDLNDAKVLFERIEPELRLVICGAGHVGSSLARLASLIGYRVTLIDDRAEFLTRALLPDEKIDLALTSNWGASVREAIGNGRGVSVAVVTRGHNEDEECMRACITTQASYLGMIGSKRRTNIVIDRLRQAGAEEKQLLRVHAPIGLDIGAVTPEEVALAIMAEIVAERRGGGGSSLSNWRRTT